MNKYLPWIVLAVFVVVGLIGLTISANNTASEYKVREEIALERIAVLDSTVSADTEQLAALQTQIDSLDGEIVNLMTEANNLRWAARIAKEKALAEAAVEYTEDDSTLIERVIENIPGARPMSLCRDELIEDRFCVTRPFVEQHLTWATVTLPDYRAAILGFEQAANADLLLINSIGIQNSFLKEQSAVSQSIAVSHQNRAAEFEQLYSLADHAYRKERFLRKATTITAIAAVMFLLFR